MTHGVRLPGPARGSSSFGRAPGLQPGGGGFETCVLHGPIVYWLGYRPLKAVNGVRIPVGLRNVTKGALGSWSLDARHVTYALLVELADTPVLGTGARKGVRVRVSRGALAGGYPSVL